MSYRAGRKLSEHSLQSVETNLFDLDQISLSFVNSTFCE